MIFTSGSVQASFKCCAVLVRSDDSSRIAHFTWSLRVQFMVDFHAQIQACSCDAGSSVAHPNCVTAAINKASQRGHPTQGSELAICHICGDETGGIVTGAQNAVASKDMGSLNSNTRSSTRAMKADHSLRGTKRLRSALTNGALPAKGEIVEKRPAKSCKDETDGHVLQQSKPDTPVSDQGKV